MSTLHTRVGDLLEPLAGDEAMAVDYRNQRWSVRTGAVIAAAIMGIIVLLVALWWWLREPDAQLPPAEALAGPSAQTPVSGSAEPVTDNPPTGASEPDQIVVSVVGLVRNPSVVTLAPGARVVDAIAAAGGVLPEADIASVNQAAELSDGEQIAVGSTPLPGGGSVPGAGAGSGSPGQPGAVNINTASAEELEQLPGVGPATAQNIVSYREEHGAFTSIDQLLEVNGIGPAKLADMKEHVQL